MGTGGSGSVTAVAAITGTEVQYSSMEGVAALDEGVRTKETPTPISSEATATEPNTGYLHNLTPAQREKLFQLWGMLFAYFAQPYDSVPAKKKGSQH